MYKYYSPDTVTVSGAASAMEEGLPQDEDPSHLTTLTSPVNSTPVHTVNNTGTSGCQEQTANAAMEIDSPANVHALPAPAVPHLFPVFTRSVSRRGGLWWGVHGRNKGS